jgi:endogenous inhibitor of DNA gyrase (YacG/DUF329 family)
MTCPICARETVHAYRPFCSRRCADADLGNWLTGRYAVPVETSEDDADPPDQPWVDTSERH